MDEMLMILAPIIGGIFLYGIMQIVVKLPGTSLNQKFVSLGTLPGKTLEEIREVCGSPNAVSAMGNGQTLYQWQATGYHIALLFDENDICLGISSEISV